MFFVTSSHTGGIHLKYIIRSASHIVTRTVIPGRLQPDPEAMRDFYRYSRLVTTRDFQHNRQQKGEGYGN